MIRTDSSLKGDVPPYVTLRSSASIARDLKPGSLVRVSVLAALPDGTFRVAVGGRELVAAGLRGASVGSSFSARVRIEGDAVVLSPVLDSAVDLSPGTSALFAELGIPETPVSSFLVSFFRTIEMKLDPALIRSVMKTAARFPGRELRAAEAAAILAERGISADDDTVADLLDLIEGRSGAAGDHRAGSGGQDADDGGRRDADSAGRESDTPSRTQTPIERSPIEGSSIERRRALCAFVNHKKGQTLHWLVVPFSREFAGRLCSGSVRFLVDLAAQKTVETRISFFEGPRCWDFSITGKACSFTANPEFSPVVFEEFIVYLKHLLEKTGIETVSWHEPGENSGSAIKSVDLEI